MDRLRRTVDPATPAEYAYLIAGVWVFVLAIAGHFGGRATGHPVIATFAGIGAGIGAMYLQMAIAAHAMRRPQSSGSPMGNADTSQPPLRPAQAPAWMGAASAVILGGLLGAAVAFGGLGAPPPGTGFRAALEPELTWLLGAAAAGAALGLVAWLAFAMRAQGKGRLRDP